MPAPTTAAELLDLIQRSGVADDAKLRAYIQKLNESATFPTDPAKLAGVLVRDGVITYFQAEQLLQGKYKRFTIGKYKVLEKLGAGGMAQVFLCEHKLMRRRVAIKVLPTAKADDPSSLERFYREARAVAAVDHPNIVRAYDIDQDENLHFLVMEYVDGTNLQDLVKKFGPLDVLRACHYIYGASVGLQHAHEMGLVHRDVKPGNILVDRAGVVKILDMGLARFFHDDDDALTKKYDENVLGTADYLAPEQALDSHTVDIRADIYSLGATLYYLLTGSAPFPEGSVAQKLIWHQNRPPRPIRSIRPEVPEELVAIVEKMMAKSPQKRYQTPAEVMAALAGWVATPISPPAERELPQLSLAAGGTGSAPGTSRGPATMIGPVVAPASYAQANGPPETNIPTSTDEGSPNPLVWESLDTDSETQTVARGDTDRAPPHAPPRPRRDHNAPFLTRKLRMAIAAALVLAAAVSVYFAFFTDTAPPPPPGPGGSGGPRTITVSKAAGANHVPTLREALSKAGPGDTIVIAEAKLTEPPLRISTKHRGLTIEGKTADGTVPVIEPSSKLPTMVDVESAEDVTIRNVQLDGLGRADFGLEVSGVCPGLTLDRVTARGISSAAIRFMNAAGEADRPLQVDRVRALVSTPAQIGILVKAAENVDTRRLAIRNSRFEGTGVGVGIRVEGTTSDLMISGNRFYNLDRAISLAEVPRAKAIQGEATSNTVCQAKTGIEFDTTRPNPKDPFGAFRVRITLNYFAKTQAVSAFIGPTAPVGATFADNAYGEGSVLGKVVVNATPLAKAPLLPTDVNHDATFLRFPGGPRQIAPGKKVGAP